MDNGSEGQFLVLFATRESVI